MPLVVFFDLDDTLIYKYKYPNIDLSKELPDYYFIKGCVEFIKHLNKANVKVCIASHSYIHHSSDAFNLRNRILEYFNKNGATIDSFVTINDVDEKGLLEKYQESSHRDIVNLYGKGKSSYMAELSLKRIGIEPDMNGKYPDIDVVTIGDQRGDIRFAGHIQNNLSCTKALPIHINALNFSTEKLKDVRAEINAIRLAGKQVEEVIGFSELYPIIEKEFGICLDKESEVSNIRPLNQDIQLNVIECSPAAKDIANYKTVVDELYVLFEETISRTTLLHGNLDLKTSLVQENMDTAELLANSTAIPGFRIWLSLLKECQLNFAPISVTSSWIKYLEKREQSSQSEPFQHTT